MAKRIGRGINKAGRSEGEARFVQLPYWVLETPAARSLSGTAFKVLIYLLKRYNGVNNGAIGFGSRSGCFVRRPGAGAYDDLPIGIAPRTISDALFELEAAGFIACTKASTFDQKRMTKEWRLTWLSAADAKIPTKEFATAGGDFKRPKQQKAERLRALSPQLQGAQPPSNTPEIAQSTPYRAATRSMAEPHRAATRPHIVTIPSDSDALSVARALLERRAHAASMERPSARRFGPKLPGTAAQ